MLGFLKRAMLAIGCVAVATGVKLLLGPLGHNDADALFLLSVVFAVWRADARTGVFAVVLAAAAQAFFFLEPRYSFGVHNPSDIFGLASWLVEGSLVCFLVAALNAKRRIATETTELQRTVNQKTESALADSERAYDELFNASPVAMYAFDPTTHQFTSANDAALALYGYSREAFLGMRLWDLKLPEDCEPVRLGLEQRPRGDFRVSTTHKTREGKLLAVDVLSRGIKVGGKLTRVCAAVDQSERQRLEAQLRQAQKMDAVGRLAGGVAHDFNNMLAVILGFTWSLLEDTPVGSDSYSSLKEIMRAAERSADLTRQLLTFSRQSPQRAKVTDVNAIVESTRTLVRRLVGEDVEVVAHLSGVRCASEVDDAQIEQVIMNLVVNARDAMPKGGKLTIETSIVDCDSGFVARNPGMTAGRHVMLAVSDSGVGMDAATITQIFEPFFTTKPSGKGTGLGLSIVFGIVAQHGGHISVYSELGAGRRSRFSFASPMKSSRRSRSGPRSLLAVTRRSSSSKTRSSFSRSSSRSCAAPGTRCSRPPLRSKPSRYATHIEVRSTCSSPTSSCRR